MKTVSFLSFAVALCLGFTPIYAQAYPSGLVGWWQGESNVVDSVGGHNGFINLGVNYVPGVSGQAFDVEGGIVTVPDNANLRPLTNVTLQVWVKSKAPNTFKYLIAKAHNTANSSYAIYTGSTGGAAFFVSLLQPTNNSDVLLVSPSVAPSVIWDNNWHQLTGVFDGTTSHLYVDGTEVGSGTANTNPSLTNISYVNPQPLIIGSYRAAGDFPFVGAIDEAKIFNVAMTASDVASTFNNSSSPAATNGLVSWYQAEGNAQDSWGSNHGTISITGARSIDYTTQGRTGTGLFSHGSEAIVPDSTDLQPNNLTLQLWVKSVSPGTFKYPVSKWRGTNGATFANSYAIYTGSGGGAYFFVNLVNGTTDSTILSPQAPAASVWDGAYHLLTGTWDGSVSRLYIDGFEQGSGTTNTISTATTIDYSLSRQLLFGDYETPAACRCSALKTKFNSTTAP